MEKCTTRAEFCQAPKRSRSVLPRSGGRRWWRRGARARMRGLDGGPGRTEPGAPGGGVADGGDRRRDDLRRQALAEVKLACLYDTADRVGTPTRGMLTRRDVVAVGGTPEALAAQLWPQAAALGPEHRRVIVLGDGALWIWHLAAEVFPQRVEILHWYHADEHISAVARLLRA